MSISGIISLFMVICCQNARIMSYFEREANGRLSRISDPRCSLAGPGGRVAKATFVNFTTVKNEKRTKIRYLNAGWGTTNKYSWKEDDERVYVTAAIGSGISSNEIDVKITNESLSVTKKGSPLPLIAGKLRGKVNVDETFWFLESKNGMGELQITLKKSSGAMHTWFGVIFGEQVQYQSYADSKNNLPYGDLTIGRNLEPGGVFWRKTFEDLKKEDLNEIFKRWITRESNDLIPFGKPKMEIELEYIPRESGGNIVFKGLEVDVDEYINVTIQQKCDKIDKVPRSTDRAVVVNEGSEIVFTNSPTTGIIRGEFGMELAEKLKRSLNALIRQFERDLHEFRALSANTTGETKYDYAGSDAFLRIDNMEEYKKYHENFSEILGMSQKKGVSDPAEVFKEKDLGVSVDLNASDGESVEEKKKILNELTEAIRHTQRQQPIETVKSLASDFRKNLALDDVEFNQLWQTVIDRVAKEDQGLNDKQLSASRMDLKSYQDPLFGDIAENLDSPSPEKTVCVEDMFDELMSKEDSLLCRKYKTLSATQREHLRKRWKKNERRLQLLLTELFQTPSEKCATICNNYRELLISEDYPTLMKAYLAKNVELNEVERRKLVFMNEFVLSLYKDAEIYTCQDEKLQLSKIKQICEWAVNDFEKLNDFVQSNKKLYDTNFLTYLRFAISKETQRIREEGFSVESGPDPRQNPWLSILTIIERAITSLIEADMAEDVYFIGSIVCHRQPDVRSYMLEFILATMPKCDWKAFKDLIMSMTNSLINKPAAEREMQDIPEYVPEACLQLREDVEKMIPDWLIDDMLSEDDRRFMIENNEKKVPVLQLDLKYMKEDKPKGKGPVPAATTELTKVAPNL